MGISTAVIVWVSTTVTGAAIVGVTRDSTTSGWDGFWPVVAAAIVTLPTLIVAWRTSKKQDETKAATEVVKVATEEIRHAVNSQQAELKAKIALLEGKIAVKADLDETRKQILDAIKLAPPVAPLPPAPPAS